LRSNGNKYKICLASIIVACGIVYFSYSFSRSRAESVVGDSLKYFNEIHTSISIKPINGKTIAWIFEFSNQNIFDADFEIYVSMLGKIVKTNPKDLEERLRSYEKLKVHPYSIKQ